MPAAEHIERQITVVVVIAVEETLFLMPVQRVVGGVEVEGDLRRRRRMGVEKQIDKQRFDRRGIILISSPASASAGPTCAFYCVPIRVLPARR